MLLSPSCLKVELCRWEDPGRRERRRFIYIVRDSAYFVYPLFIVGWLALFFCYVLPASGVYGVPTVFLSAPEVFLTRTYVYIQPAVARESIVYWMKSLRPQFFLRKKKFLFPLVPANNMKFIASGLNYLRCCKNRFRSLAASYSLSTSSRVPQIHRFFISTNWNFYDIEHCECFSIGNSISTIFMHLWEIWRCENA